MDILRLQSLKMTIIKTVLVKMRLKNHTNILTNVIILLFIASAKQYGIVAFSSSYRVQFICRMIKHANHLSSNSDYIIILFFRYCNNLNQAKIRLILSLMKHIPPALCCITATKGAVCLVQNHVHLITHELILLKQTIKMYFTQWNPKQDTIFFKEFLRLKEGQDMGFIVE